FGFRQVYPDCRTGIVGGLLYHGQPDQSFPKLVEPSVRKDTEAIYFPL
ncbi:MAG: DUF4120 family protein, partial [Odoribacter sp.]|nr:DUF4120 family protein [Odoribacter sp.]